MTEAAAALRAGLRRGTVVTVASAGVYSGKPRPAVVVQAERWLQAHPSVTLCPLTSSVVEAPLVRIAVAPSPRNGLRKPSQLMVDRLFSVPIQALGAVVGQLEPQVSRVNPLGRFATTKLAGECPQVVAGDNLGAATRKLSYPAARSLISTGFS
jgi:mRNA interferase MazF